VRGKFFAQFFILHFLDFSDKMFQGLIKQIRNRITQILQDFRDPARAVGRKMKIQGLGVDIIEIKRIKKIAKKNKGFLTRVFTDEEISYCQKKKNPWQHLAVRFAAKEAIWKAIGKPEISLKNISVSNLPSGKPAVLLNGELNEDIYLSLSHCEEYALAQAIKMKE